MRHRTSLSTMGTCFAGVCGLLLFAAPAAHSIEHPFCLWTREEAARLRKSIETDPVARQQYDRLAARAARKMKLGYVRLPASR